VFIASKSKKQQSRFFWPGFFLAKDYVLLMNTR
jgi:hypothetical protein